MEAKVEPLTGKLDLSQLMSHPLLRNRAARDRCDSAEVLENYRPPASRLSRSPSEPAESQVQRTLARYQRLVASQAGQPLQEQNAQLFSSDSLEGSPGAQPPQRQLIRSTQAPHPLLQQNIQPVQQQQRQQPFRSRHCSSICSPSSSSANLRQAPEINGRRSSVSSLGLRLSVHRRQHHLSPGGVYNSELPSPRPNILLPNFSISPYSASRRPSLREFD